MSDSDSVVVKSPTSKTEVSITAGLEENSDIQLKTPLKYLTVWRNQDNPLASTPTDEVSMMN